MYEGGRMGDGQAGRERQLDENGEKEIYSIQEEREHSKEGELNNKMWNKESPSCLIHWY